MIENVPYSFNPWFFSIDVIISYRQSKYEEPRANVTTENRIPLCRGKPWAIQLHRWEYHHSKNGRQHQWYTSWNRCRNERKKAKLIKFEHYNQHNLEFVGLFAVRAVFSFDAETHTRTAWVSIDSNDSMLEIGSRLVFVVCHVSEYN